jgi:uncharacterized protein YaaW (UPF0174 family)
MAQALLGHGLGFATNWILVKSVYVLAGPLGLAFAALFSANMVAGPAYRATIPCVVQVALIKGGTGKAEDAKLPDAGISLKQCPEK